MSHFIRIIKPARDIRDGKQDSPVTRRMLQIQAIRDRRSGLEAVDPWRRAPRGQPAVLVVDDDHAIHDALRFILRARCTVKSAMSAEEAIEIMAESPGVELVFMDINLPGMNGMAAMGLIKARWPAVPVTIISETNDPMVEIKAIEMGAFHFMRKDFDFDWMNELMSTALESSAAYRENEDIVNAICDLTDERDALAARVRELEGRDETAVNG